MNYSHILSIQVWSDKINQSTNYGNILTRVKNMIIGDIQTQEIIHNDKKELVSILWKQIKWSNSHSNLYNSNIVIDLPHIKDEVIYQHTKQMLKEIEEKLCIEKKYDSDYKIVFSIVKPVINQPKFLDNIEFVDL